MSDSGRAVVPIDGGYVVKRTPGLVHANLASAGAEAVRLSDQLGGTPFSVLQIVGVVAPQEVNRG